MKEKKILVVDFDEESLISLSNLVFEEGFQAVTAMDGLAGYEKFQAENFDLVIIEPMLPKLHGFELMKRINQDPSRKTPIIVVTGIYREPSCKMEALQVYGAAGYFTKPWNKDDLRAKMLQVLVNGKQAPVEKKDTPAPHSIKRPTPRQADEWGLLRGTAAPRPSKASGGLDDIEKELQAAVSGLTGTTRKKETVKTIVPEKKETQAGVDGDIETLLKGAIGGLGLDEKKKTVTSRPEVKRPSPPPPITAGPAAKPLRAAGPEITMDTIEKEGRTPLAREIKERIPPQPKMEAAIPPPPAQVRLDAPKKTRSIDQTLLEIDKKPIETEKSTPEMGRVVLEHEPIAPHQKAAYFDDYAEPAKRKPPAALIGGLAAAVLIVAGSTFIIVKSKKPKEPAGQMVTSLQPSLPSEFAERQMEIPAEAVSRGPESRPTPKSEPTPPPGKETVKSAEQSAAPAASVPIAPALPEDTPPLGLKLQSDPEIVSPTTDSETPTPQVNSPVPQSAPSQTETPPDKPRADEPTRVLAKPGDLVPLEGVDVAPVLLKRISPKYPVQALNMGVGGTVTVNALVSETGEVIRTEILKGIKGGFGLERAAETAIRQWQFKPAEKDGVPVRVWKPLDIIFKPNLSQNQ
ncbi:MAG: TonB family protein [Candidatus Aminicenantes bacterium]|nr:TonB family protein [Candidatus Aminicenantes bacterium]